VRIPEWARPTSFRSFRFATSRWTTASRLAKRLADRIGRELEIPCFLYAAGRRRRTNDVRSRRSARADIEGLRTRIGTDPTRVPDTGPHAIHPTAGCTAVGARFFLVAYNVNLGTTDPALAESIAADLRESGRKVKSTAADGTAVETVVPGKVQGTPGGGLRTSRNAV
jgi:glutamate formiminotransferase